MIYPLSVVCIVSTVGRLVASRLEKGQDSRCSFQDSEQRIIVFQVISFLGKDLFLSVEQFHSITALGL